jgi:uncharacterized protein YxeA
MKKNIICIIAVVFLILVSFSSLHTAKASSFNLSFINTTWYVDGNEPEDGDGSIGSPFNKIQDAIDAASSDDTILVK